MDDAVNVISAFNMPNLKQLIDESIHKAIKAKEKDFLQAYRGHISQVQEDLEKTKEDADDLKGLKQIVGEDIEKSIVDLKHERVNKHLIRKCACSP